MTFKPLKKSLKFLITLSLLQLPFAPLAMADGTPTDVPKKSEKGCPLDCEGKAAGIVESWKANLGSQGGTSTQNDNSARSVSGATCAAQLSALAEKCEKRKAQCSQCGDKAKECEQRMPEIIAGIQAQSGNCNSDGMSAQGVSDATSADTGGGSVGGGGGMGDMMGPLMMAGIGGLVGYMLGKESAKDKDKDKDKALQDNGTIDCTKKDAYKYQGCNAYLEAMCGSNPSAANCSAFSSRYCGPTSSSSSGSMATASYGDDDDGEIEVMGKKNKVPTAPTGEGVGSPYCRHRQAVVYCQPSGRTNCPSCIQLQKMNSPACVQNPTLCIAQNSQAEIEAAKVSCPTDPAFSDPAFLAGGATGGAGSPVVSLPGDPVATTGAGAPTIVDPGVSVQSVAGTGLREAQGNGMTSSMGGSAGGAGGREAAAVGGKAGVAVSGRPASDVDGKYGPSLFAVSSQVIRSRCSAGKFKNCP